MSVISSYSPLLPCSCIPAMLEGKISSLFSNQINTTGVTSGAGTAYPSEAPEFIPDFQWGSCYSIFSFMCMFCRSLFVLLPFYFWPLFCLFFFDLRIPITPLVSSNSAQFYVCMHITYKIKMLIKFVSYLRQVGDFQLKYISFII